CHLYFSLSLSLLLIFCSISFIFHFFFFFNDTSTTEIYTLSLHDALPIFVLLLIIVIALISATVTNAFARNVRDEAFKSATVAEIDRKSTRLNSSHVAISYAVFCLKKKKKKI